MVKSERDAASLVGTEATLKNEFPAQKSYTCARTLRTPWKHHCHRKRPPGSMPTAVGPHCHATRRAIGARSRNRPKQKPCPPKIGLHNAAAKRDAWTRRRLRKMNVAWSAEHQNALVGENQIFNPFLRMQLPAIPHCYS